MSVFKALAEIAPLPIWHGVLARAVEGRDVTFAIVELDPESVVAQHQHPNEQLGIILTGALRFHIGAETRDLTPGDTYVIPANVPHDAVAGPAGAVVIDVFSPVRADWRQVKPGAPQTPKWP